MILDERDIRDALTKMKPPSEAALIKTPSQVRDDVVALVHDDSFGMQGYPIHFQGFEPKLRFRPSEVSIWCGQNHTGKSEVLNQFILSQSGECKSFIMSPEMPLHVTVKNMCQQICKSDKPPIQTIDKFINMIEGKIYLLDQDGMFNPDDVIALIRYVHAEYGCFHFVIDSLMKCGINENEDHGRIKNFVDQLCITAKYLKCHIHLVAHSKKPNGIGERPSRYDIKGSGAISDLVDNVLIMWRNNEKEKRLDEGVRDHAKEMELEAEPDARLIVDKQRHGSSWRGSINLKHCQQSRSFYVPDNRFSV